jgi:hypothetical protein
MRILIALKIMLRAIVGVIFTPVALRGIRQDVHRLVAKAPEKRPAGSGVPAPSTLTPLIGVLEDANEKGIKLQGHPRWVDYGQTFRGNPVSRSDIGKPVELVLVHAKSGPFLRSIRIRADAPPAQMAAPAHPPVIALPLAAARPRASANQIDFVLRLARLAGLTEEDLESLAQSRFRKEFTSLSEAEMSRVITFLGGYPRRRDRKRR